MSDPVQHRYFLEIAFNGSGYHGWQIQKNAMTIQEVMNSCIGLLLQQPVNCMGCGRTDARVHAKQFFLHFRSDEPLSADFARKLNHLTPRDIVIKQLYCLKQKGHARFSALKRTYHYQITLRKDPFLIDLATFYYGTLDIDAMNKAASFLEGEHDFTTFAKQGSSNSNGICTVDEATWKQYRDRVVFKITANRFLRRMVRMMTGTFVLVGTHKITPDRVKEILELRDSQYSGKAAPPDGLYLTNVAYPEGMLEKMS